MKMSLRIFGILLIGLFAISMVGCGGGTDEGKTTPTTPVEETPPPSPEKQLTGQYRLIRYELDLDGVIIALKPPEITGSLVIVNGGSFFMEFVDNKGDKTSISSDKWSATATNIILEDDPSTITYTLQGTDLTLVLTDHDVEGLSVTLDWEKKA